MVARVIRSVVLMVSIGSILTGCGRQVSQDPSRDPNLLAAGPDADSLPIPRPFIVASIDVVGGLPAWAQCRKLRFSAVVAADRPDGGLYLTKHDFALYPWSDAIQVTAGEPFARFSWQVVRGGYSFKGDEDLDVSPLKGFYHAYSEAVLQIVTAPARMLESGVTLTRRSESVQLAGQWYQPIDARYQPREVASEKKGDEERQVTLVERAWTQGTYFQNGDSSFVDVVWLGNPVTRSFLLVRGYDYSRVPGREVLVPTRVEVFRSGPQAQVGPRIAMIDLEL